LPFFIEWLTQEHPSKDGIASTSISKILLADDNKLSDSIFQDEIEPALNKIAVEWIGTSNNDGESGIVAIELENNSGRILID
jgi:hypothetical protein